MFEKKKETVLEPSTAETIIGASLKVKGNLQNEENIRIEGFVQGTVKTTKNLIIGERAVLEASVQAENALIAGELKGNIQVKERLEIAKTGRVYGDISTKILAIAPGAIFNGRSTMEIEGKKEKIE